MAVTLFELLAKIGLDSREYESGISRLSSGIKTFAKGATVAISAAATATTAFAATAVKSGMEFDTAMSQVAATMGKTTDEITDLRDFAQEMGRTTAFSATQAAEALNYMALAGYDAETAMSTLPTVLDLAAAGGIDLAYASDMITDTQSALGLSLDETITLVDQMAKASSKSNTSVQQLGEALLTVGGTAKNMAGGTSEMATVLGVLADNGIKGTEGGTHLRNMILRLSAPTEKGAKVLDDLGVAIFNAEGEMRSFADIFPELNAAMSDMTDEEKTLAISELFNLTDLSAANALLATSTERWEDLSAQIGEAEGAASAMATTQLDNLAGDITLFKSALEGAQIAVSDQLTPSLRELVSFGSTAITELTNSFVEGGFEGAVEQLGDILATGLSSAISKAPELLNIAVSLIKTLIDGLKKNAKMLASGATGIITTLINGIADMFPEVIELGLDVLIALGEGIADNIGTVTDKITDVIIKIIDTLTDPAAINDLIDAGIDILVALIDGIDRGIPRLVSAIPTVISKIIDVLSRNAGRIAETGVKLIVSLVDNLTEIVKGIAAAIPDIIRGIVDNLLTAESLSQLAEAGVDIFIAIFDNLPEIIRAIATAVGDIMGQLVGMLTDTERTGQLHAAGLEMVTALMEVFPNFIESTLSIIDDLFGTHIAEWYSQVTDFFMDFGSQLYQMANQDVLDEIELSSKYSNMQTELQNAALAAIREGATAEEAFNKAKQSVLDTTEELYAFDVLSQSKSLDFGFDMSVVEGLIRSVETAKYSQNSAEYYAMMGRERLAQAQPLVVTLQMPSGVEVGRQYIEDINTAKRVDGVAY